MSKWYTPKKVKGLYGSSKEPFKLSRSKIEFFLECPRCFYIDRKLGISRPPGFPFNLNIAVDALLKQEFDTFREKALAHPLIKNYKVDAIPAKHEKIDDWRNTLKGIQFLHEPTNFLVYGAIDDLWQNSKGEYIVVDYKATSKFGDIKELDKDWHDGYKRQMEIYQWLFEKNGFPVSKTGYFVYCNGRVKNRIFNAKLEFDVTLIPHKGDNSWVEGVIYDIHKCLNSDQIPESGKDCEYCDYYNHSKAVREA
jgi:CRISPR/Cas system-associated exonuclease Cas4 (RecB family)